ncbi:DUF4328 domain-containing protein [Bacteroidota bacterium]
MPQVKNNRYRARQAMWLLKIIILFDVLIIAFDIKEFSLLNSLENNLHVTTYDVGANETRQALTGIFYFIVALCSGIAFLGWFYRAYTNFERAGIGTRYPSKYAIISFFIPLINLYFPYRIMSEIWHKISVIVFTNENAQEQSGIKSLNWWWILWLASIFFAAIYFFSAVTAENIHDLRMASINNIISSLVDIPAALVTISLIGRISKAEEKWFSLYGGSADTG